MDIVYLNITKHVEITKKNVTVKDLGKVYCGSQKLTNKIADISIFSFDSNGDDHQSVTVMYIIKKINENLDQPIIINNIGESECLINFTQNKKNNKLLTYLKIAFVVATTFIGSIFAIMTYNEDVSVSDIFDKIYYIIMQTQKDGPGVLELSYAFGVAIGIIVFFNHFGKKKLTKDPTPMEVEMEKYEKDVCDTVLKEAARKDNTIDVP